MFARRIKRWHWIAISLVAGTALGWLNRLSREDWTSTYGEGLSKIQFIESLSSAPVSVGKLTNLIVYPEEMQMGGGTRMQVHVVSGQYEEMPSTNGARPTPALTRRCFVAELPFDGPRIEASGPSGATVMNYLDAVKVPYTYARWRDPKLAMAFWVGGSFLLIGIIWPSILNLLAYGSIFAPPHENRFDLSGATSAAASPSHGSALTDQELADLEKLESEMEKNLASGAAASIAAPPSPAAPIVRPLATHPGDAPAPESDIPGAEFGAKRDDFYPTARQPKRHEHED